MEKSAKMTQVVELLQHAAASLNDAAELLAGIDGESSTSSGTVVSQVQPELTFEEVRAFLANMSANRLTDQVKDLIHKYGGRKLSEIDPVYYPDLISDAKKIADAT